MVKKLLKKSGFSDFHPVKASPNFGDPMGNHTREAWSASANSQMGGTIGDSRNERALTRQQPPRTAKASPKCDF